MEEMRMMTNEEEMETAMNEEESVDTSNERSGMGTGLAMIIGGGLAIAGMAGFKKLKKIIADRKARKNNEDVIEASDYEVIDESECSAESEEVDSEIIEVTKDTKKKKK